MIFSNEFKMFILENFELKDYNNKSFLTEFRKLLVESNSLDDFIDDIIFSKLKSGDLASNHNRIIICDTDNIKEYIEHLKQVSFISPEFINCYNCLFFQILIHEVRHSYQDKISNNKVSSPWIQSLRNAELIRNGHLKLDLMKPTINDKIIGNRLYKRYHNLFPGERDADMVSINFIKELYQEYFMDDIIGNSDLSLIYYNIMSYGYAFYNNSSTCPLREFYSNIGKLDIYDNFDFSEYDLKERINYGMPLTNEEFEDEKKRILYT